MQSIWEHARRDWHRGRHRSAKTLLTAAGLGARWLESISGGALPAVLNPLMGVSKALAQPFDTFQNSPYCCLHQLDLGVAKDIALLWMQPLIER